MKKVRLYCLVILLCFSEFAIAEISYSAVSFDLDFKRIEVTGISLVGGLYTYHIFGDGTYRDLNTDESVDYNESNDYFAIRLLTNTQWNFAFGRANNSYRQESYMLSAEWNPLTYRWIDIGSDFMITTGYADYTKIGGVRAYLLPAGSPFIRNKFGKHFGIKHSFIYFSVYTVTAEMNIPFDMK